MPFCPNCKSEYVKDKEYCSDCGAKLVDQLEEEPETELNSDEEYDEEVFLTTVANDIQASIIISKLSTYDIPVLKKYRQFGSVMVVFMGTSPYGVDLYVPSKLLSKAKEALDLDLTDTDDLAFDKMMDEYGFDDIDNLEFEEDNEVKDDTAKDIHLVNKAAEADIPEEASEKEEVGRKGNDSKAFSNSDELQEAQNRHNKRTKFLLITIPLIFAVILYLLQLLSGK